MSDKTLPTISANDTGSASPTQGGGKWRRIQAHIPVSAGDVVEVKAAIEGALLEAKFDSVSGGAFEVLAAFAGSEAVREAVRAYRVESLAAKLG